MSQPQDKLQLSDISPLLQEKQHRFKLPLFQKPSQYQDTKTRPSKIPNGSQKLIYSLEKNEKADRPSIKEMVRNSHHYKQLMAKMKKLQQEHILEKQFVINSINVKNEIINRLRQQDEDLDNKKQELLEKQKQFQEKLAFIREENERIRDYLEIYQNREIDLEVLQYAINTDNMTYEELLELQEKMGNVSKGFSPQQALLIPKYEYITDRTDELCTICYYQFKKGEITNVFDCNHRFHDGCISEWLARERLCPMCKQEIKLPQEEEQ